MSSLTKKRLRFYWQSAPDVQMAPDDTASLAIWVHNPYGYALTYTALDALPAGVTLSGNTLTATGAAVAEADVTFRITDGTDNAEVVGTVAILAQDTGSLRPPEFANIPSWIGDTTVGLTAPNDLSDVGYRPVVPLRSYANVVNITPAEIVNGYICDQRNTIYRLTGDATANTWAIAINAGNVIVDLQGYTLTYLNVNATLATGTDTSRAGIRIDDSVGTSPGIGGHIEVCNGYIRQGAGDITNTPANGYGRGANPIRAESLYTQAVSSISYRGLHITHRVKFASAIHHNNVSSHSVLAEYVTCVDEGNMVYLRTNQQAEISIGQYDNPTEVRYCRIQNARHCGVRAKLVHHNEIRGDGWWTNSAGWLAQPQGRFYNNNVYMTGCHPQGVFVRDTTDCQLSFNWIESKYTRPGEMLPSPTGDIDNIQNFATCLTFRFGDDSDMQFFGNTCISWAENDSVVHPTNGKVYDAEARVVFAFKYPTTTSTNNRIYGNLMIAIAEDDAARAFVLGYSGQLGHLTADTNRLVTNMTHFWIHDEYYSELRGYPLVKDNSVERLGAVAAYRTARHGNEDGYPFDTIAQMRFESNDWANGSWPFTTRHFTAGHDVQFITEPGSVS